MSELEGWVREDLGLTAHDTVSVSEQAGSHEGCVSETVITIDPVDEEPFEVTVHKAIGDIDRIDLLAALAFGDDHS